MDTKEQIREWLGDMSRPLQGGEDHTINLARLTVKEILDQLDAAEQALAGEKARVDIAERRSIAAGEQAEELQAQVIDLKARIERLRSALGFYGQEDNYNSFPWVPKSLDSVIERDEGEEAREALKADDAASK